jgi:SAM-dependent methyltransferase
MDDDARAEAIREMRRVLKPLGRALVVEFGEGAVGGANVVARMHARRNPRIVAEVAAAMGRAGLEGITAGDLGCAGLAYVLAGSPAPRTGAQTPSAG